MKHLLLVFLLAAIAAPALAQDSQDQAPDPEPAAAAGAPSPTLAQSPEITPLPAGVVPKGAKPVDHDTKEAIKDLLVEQGNDVIAIQNNELAYLNAKTRLEAAKADVDARLQAALQAGARKDKIDVSKFTCDVKHWLWMPNK